MIITFERNKNYEKIKEMPNIAPQKSNLRDYNTGQYLNQLEGPDQIASNSSGLYHLASSAIAHLNVPNSNVQMMHPHWSGASGALLHESGLNHMSHNARSNMSKYSFPSKNDKGVPPVSSEKMIPRGPHDDPKTAQDDPR